MKLTAAQLNTVEQQLGVRALKQSDPATPKLIEVFGDHTFFLDEGGVNIVEQKQDAGETAGHVVRLASWSEDREQLHGHEPKVLAVSVSLGNDPSTA